jgi:hypothetical protein
VGQDDGGAGGAGGGGRERLPFPLRKSRKRVARVRSV